MKVLGYPLTYETKCFTDGGCGAPVFARTNGTGDFVLFDKLGWPWPVHDCFLNRFCDGWEISPAPKGGAVYTDLEAALVHARTNEEYKRVARRASEDTARIPPKQITRVDPGGSPRRLKIVGYVQDLTENRVARMTRELGTFGQEEMRRKIGSRTSQITVVDGDFCSYTILADLSQTVIGKKMTVVAEVAVVKILKLGPVFVCEKLDVLALRAV